MLDAKAMLKDNKSLMSMPDTNFFAVAAIRQHNSVDVFDLLVR